MAFKPPNLSLLYAKLAIRFVREGCANRPFYHIVVMPVKKNQHEPPIEQIGSYDPLPNERNEKLLAINYERLKYWLAKDPQISKPALEILGLAGYFHIHPRTAMKAWKIRFTQKEEAEKAAAAAAAAEAASKTTTEEKVQT